MWAEQEKYRNHFLQMELKHLEPKKINNLVNREMEKSQYSQNNCNVIHNPKELCKSAKYFEDRAQLAYGLWALPKLMKELDSDDLLVQWKALNSLSEYLVNPLHAQRAITQYDIVRSCQNVFLRIRLKFKNAKYLETERLLVIFYHIARHMNGAKKIVSAKRLMHQFYWIIRDRECHMDKIAQILSLLTQDPENVAYLINTFKVMDNLKEIWNRDICIPYYPEDLWRHLSQILELYPLEAINKGFFEILLTRIKGRLFQYHIWDMKCFALLLRCPEGQKRFVDIDGIKEMYIILTEKHQILNSHENVIFTLMSGLFDKKILWRCREFTDLPLIIMEFAKNKKNPNQQLMCFQTLREMGVMPCIKRFIKENCLKDIKDIQCETMVNERQRDEIVYWLEREIYHTTDIRKEPIAKENENFY